MSTSRGVAPSRAMQPAVAKNEYVLVMTSSPGADAERHHRDEQRVGSRRDADGVGDAERIGQLALERLDLGPLDEPLAVADASDRRQHLVADRPVLRLEIEQRHRGWSRHRVRRAQRMLRASERQSPARPRPRGRCAGHALPWRAAVGVEDDVDLFAGVGRQVDHHRDPLPVRLDSRTG